MSKSTLTSRSHSISIAEKNFYALSDHVLDGSLAYGFNPDSHLTLSDTVDVYVDRKILPSTRISIYDFGIGSTLHYRQPCGFTLQIPQLDPYSDLDRVPGTSPWHEFARRCRTENKIVVEIAFDSGEPNMHEVAVNQIAEDMKLWDAGNTKRNGRILSDHKHSFYLLEIDKDYILKHPSGLFIPHLGITIGKDRHKLINKAVGLSHIDTAEPDSVFGIRYRLVCSSGSYRSLFVEQNGMPLRIDSVSDTGLTSDEFVEVYMTADGEEKLISTVGIAEALEGFECQTPKGKMNFKFYANLDDFEEPNRDHKRQLSKLNRELHAAREEANQAKNALKAQKVDSSTSLWGRFVKTLGDLISPVIKLATLVFGIFLAT